jgi:hypothetical protein
MTALWFGLQEFVLQVAKSMKLLVALAARQGINAGRFQGFASG